MSEITKELVDYAVEVVLDHARDVERLSIYEMAEDRLGREITDDEANTVLDLVRTADVAVTFPSGEVSA